MLPGQGVPSVHLVLDERVAHEPRADRYALDTFRQVKDARQLLTGQEPFPLNRLILGTALVVDVGLHAKRLQLALVSPAHVIARRVIFQVLLNRLCIEVVALGQLLQL